MIKAIETRYKGYRFRSRLEARWAVFFDAIGLDWEYEAEGYDLGGVYYLPDFIIKWPGTGDILAYVEVKGGIKNGVDYPDVDIKKVTALAMNLSIGQQIICLGDLPEYNMRYIFTSIKKHEKKYDFQPTMIIYEYSIFSGAHPYYMGITDNIGSHFMGLLFGEKAFRSKVTTWDIKTSFSNPRVDNAFNKARSARFEHGEKG